MKRLLGFVAMSMILTVPAAAPTAANAGTNRGSDFTKAPAPSDSDSLTAREIMGVVADYDVRHTNGINEYGFAVPFWMSPPDTDQSASALGSQFLSMYSVALGIQQNPSAFKYVETVDNCDGTRLVRFEQTYAYVPIRTTSIEFSLEGQRITYARLRFVPNVSNLPLCQPKVSGSALLVDNYYLPETTQTLIIVVVQDDVSAGRMRTVMNACTNDQLAFEVHLH